MHNMTKRRLPIGIQTFRKIRKENCYYVELASEGAAMAQLQAKGYADKYRCLDQPIHLIGVEFSKDTRNITAFEVVSA